MLWQRLHCAYVLTAINSFVDLAMPTLAFIHTVAGLVSVFEPLAAANLPDWASYNVVDESLLRNTIRDGALSRKTMERLAQYVFAAADAGADAVVVTCSSLGNAVDMIRPLSSVPLFRIDQGMADEAVSSATRIGVLATLSTTLAPTGHLIRNAATRAGRNCEVSELLCDGAFERLQKGDREGHDKSVISGFHALAQRAEVVVLAQASMANALASLDPRLIGARVLTSPQIGMTHIARALAGANPDPRAATQTSHLLSIEEDPDGIQIAWPGGP
jgi:Asp/Glu/hydantoin racemase